MTDNALLPIEDSYGTSKRLRFVVNLIRHYNITSVIDIGCGTGNHFTSPLAHTFPDICFWGYDRDALSISYSSSSHNICFTSDVTSLPNHCDLLILSEVLEHVNQPDLFLTQFINATSPTFLFISVPNGFGPFEFASHFLRPILTFFRYPFSSRKSIKQHIPSTLDTSQHINFFTHSQLYKLFYKLELSVVSYSNRTLICGPGFDYLVKIMRLESINSRLADFLPHWFASDWMFFLHNGAIKN
jgi:hypothetical protein